jgi:DNA repair protein RecN (Recombination protein N)
MSAQRRIQDLAGGDSRVGELEEELAKLRLELLSSAQSVTSQRTILADKLSVAVTSELHQLSMPKAIVKVEIQSRPGANDSDFTNFGLDEVAMLFTSHEGGDLLAISKAASGGELSRLMLAIEVVIAQNYPLGTYVFDEVDAGVGGKAALDVGRRLRELSKSAQVIVAIWADNQIIVEKDLSGSVTESTIRSLREDEREREIARMLSGVEDSEHAQEHARELLNLRLTEKA